jgi:hypothetical protein
VADRSGSTDEWAVIVGELYDQGNPANGSEESVLAQGPEPEARRVYADAVAEAAGRGYEYVKLRSYGQDVESWPQRTGWTS